MNFDPVMLDDLARAFAEAASRELKTQLGLTGPCLSTHTGGVSPAKERAWSTQPCNAEFRVTEDNKGPG